MRCKLSRRKKTRKKLVQIVCVIATLLTALIGLIKPIAGLFYTADQDLIYWKSIYDFSSSIQCRLSVNDFSLLTRHWDYEERTKVVDPNCTIKASPRSGKVVIPYAISSHQWRQLITLLNLLDTTFSARKIPYFLFGGALYGSYMMHDLLPWDDDIDIMVAARYRKLVEDILSSLQPEYNTVNHQAYMKIFFRGTIADWEVKWSWPFVDISFYERNTSHVWETTHQHVQERCYPIEMVFPLHRRPFGGLWIPSPRDTRAFLVRSIYHRSKRFRCGRQGWQHRYETDLGDALIPCQKVVDDSAVVHREMARGGAVERLQVKEEVVHECFVLEPENVLTKGPMSLELL